jgi:hypothetical protein
MQIQIRTSSKKRVQVVRKPLTCSAGVHAVIHPRRGFHAIPHLLWLSLANRMKETSCPEDQQVNYNRPVQVTAKQGRWTTPCSSKLDMASNGRDQEVRPLSRQNSMVQPFLAKPQLIWTAT